MNEFIMEIEVGVVSTKFWVIDVFCLVFLELGLLVVWRFRFFLIGEFFLLI